MQPVTHVIPLKRIRQVLDPDQLDALGVEIPQHGEQLLGCGQRVVGHAPVAHFFGLDVHDAARVNGDAGGVRTELPADLLVYATGYGSMNGWLADLITPEVADKVGKVWGLGSDTLKDPGPWGGELRNMWKPTQVPQLWIHGGNLHQSRHYSQFLALQLKARMEGLETPVYGLAGTHHAR